MSVSATFPKTYLCWRKYLRFRRQSPLHSSGLGTVEFILGVWFVYVFIAPLVCR